MSRTPASYSMAVVRGSTWEDEFTYQDATGAPIDLTGYQARMQVRTERGRFGTTGAETLVMELTTENGKLVWDTAALGRLRIVVAAGDTVTLNPTNEKKRKLAYGLEVYRPATEVPPAAEYVIPLVQGSVSVRGEVVR